MASSKIERDLILKLISLIYKKKKSIPVGMLFFFYARAVDLNASPFYETVISLSDYPHRYSPLSYQPI